MWFIIGTEVKVNVASGITKQGVFWLQLQQLPESNLLALANLHKQIRFGGYICLYDYVFCWYLCSILLLMYMTVLR